MARTQKPTPRIVPCLDHENLIHVAPNSNEKPPDLRRAPLELPAKHALQLQSLTRADEGFILAVAYSKQRGYAHNRAFVAELRIGATGMEMDIPVLGFAVEIVEITVTECETVNHFQGPKIELPQSTRGYGLVFGVIERKAISTGLVDHALRWKELDEYNLSAPAQDEKFVLDHSDNIQATGFQNTSNCPTTLIFNSNWN